MVVVVSWKSSIAVKRMNITIRRLVVIPSWDRYWEELEKRKLYKELQNISSRMDALENYYFPNPVLIARHPKKEKEREPKAEPIHVEDITDKDVDYEDYIHSVDVKEEDYQVTKTDRKVDSHKFECAAETDDRENFVHVEDKIVIKMKINLYQMCSSIWMVEV